VREQADAELFVGMPGKGLAAMRFHRLDACVAAR